MAHTGSFIAAGWLAAVALLGAALVAPTVFATEPDPGHKVTICHRTNSDATPYRMITVDIASSGHLRGGHDTEHQGPIWDATLKDQKVEWGDIIPPYTYGDHAYPGANWTAEGQAMWANECAIAAPSSSTEPEVPSGSVEAETGAKVPTPPPTDSLGLAAMPSDGGWGIALATVVTLAVAALCTTRAMRVRR
jgi:hypothetical protein